MDLSKEQVARLQDEAGRIRLRFKALGKALRSEPSNPDHLRERLKLQNRYAEIERILGAARVRDGNAEDELDVDLVQMQQRAISSERKPKWQSIETPAEAFIPETRQSAFRAPRVDIGGAATGPGFSIRNALRAGRIVLAVVLLITLGSILLLIYTDRVGFYIVPSNSMLPTLRPNDQLIVTRHSAYAPGDIVVLADPHDPESFLAKRIVGGGGDVLDVRGRTLYRNGIAVDEPYLHEPMDFRMPAYRVPQGAVFVAGDNRNESDDSFRWREAVPESSIRGRVRYIYLPNERRGPVPRD